MDTANEFEGSEAVDLLTPVRPIMVRPVVSSDEDVSLRSVAELMTTEAVGAVVLVGADRSAHLISERDVVAALADGVDPDDAWAIDQASEGVVGIDPEDSVLSAAREMVEEGFRHLPVMVGTDIVGMVSARDVLRAVVDVETSRELSH
jgi:CBS domain-containing protein